MDEKQIAALREDFEAWARDEYGGAIALARLGEDYKYSGPSDSWAGFLACYQHLGPRLKDAERLDFLAEHGVWVGWSKDREWCCLYARDEDGEIQPFVGWNKSNSYRTPREAIDAALDLQKEKQQC